MLIKKIGIDLGTTNSLVYVPKRGIVINEPSVVAVSSVDRKILAVGVEAKEMLGRTPDTIIAVRPMKDGVIADYKTTAAIGADIPIGSPSGHMIIDIGGGTSEMAVISLGGIVSSTSVKIGGNRFDLAIAEYIRRKYNLAL